MSESWERPLFIGETEYTKNKSQSSETIPEKNLKQKIEEQEIFPTAEQLFQATLEAHNYEQVLELENGIQYPTLNEWLKIQLTEVGWARIYPAFVRDKSSGELHFCKARIRPKEEWGGLQSEATVLQHLPKQAPAPHLIKYIPEDKQKGQLEMLITEAIKLSEASVLPLKHWTAAHAKNAATQIKELEKLSMKDLPDLPQEPVITIESMLKRSSDILEPEFRRTIEKILEEYQPYTDPILIHGDTWLKNIIVSTNPAKGPQTLFVDWERGGAGYRGQDAARTLWNLWSNDTARQSYIESYLDEPEPDKRAARVKQLKFGTVFETMRWLTTCNDILKDNTKSAQHPQERLNIEPIHKKAQAILETIQEAGRSK